MVRHSNSGLQLLLPLANWCPIFASRATQAAFYRQEAAAAGGAAAEDGFAVRPGSAGKKLNHLSRCVLQLQSLWRIPTTAVSANATVPVGSAGRSRRTYGAKPGA